MSDNNCKNQFCVLNDHKKSYHCKDGLKDCPHKLAFKVFIRQFHAHGAGRVGIYLKNALRDSKQITPAVTT